MNFLRGQLAAPRLESEMMADWFLLPLARVPAGEIRGDGLDADIAEVCGISKPVEFA
jgi:hypothetical protein